MATNKNFEVKNGLSVGGTERISSAGAFTGSLASGVTAQHNLLQITLLK